MSLSIKKVLMERDGLSEQEAEEQIFEAKGLLQQYLSEGDFMGAEDICQECFGLEPDYIFELL